eukprot:scaffold56643_cov46-Phaeocystis_antarctica.AAC.3
MHVMRAVRPTTYAPSSSAGTSDAPVECSADAARAELDRQACSSACVAEQRADTWAFGCLLTRLALHQLHQKASSEAT